ncbi:MAG: restriction endonuclease subunit S [Cyanobacteria bacterium P01_A01_bin.83]
MPIPPEIQSLVEQLNLELEEIEREATEGEKIVRQLMSLFPNNASLIQFFAYWQTTRFFVVNAKRRINETKEQLAEQPEESEIVRESGRDLATLLGEVIETKIRSRALLDRLKNLS